ncbi:SRPBCC family protein [Ruegeria pomeroyi]|nr:SRPBCC family protein [Ruegeria pomeroyi]
MRRTLLLDHIYDADPDRLFGLVTDLDTLDAVIHPWMRLDHLPSGPVHQGQVIDVDLSMLGLFPSQPYRMEVTLFDAATRRMVSEESGHGLRRLVHELQVLPAGAGARLVDRIEVEAGWAAPFLLFWLRITHAWRHHVRKRLLRTQA